LPVVGPSLASALRSCGGGGGGGGSAWVASVLLVLLSAVCVPSLESDEVLDCNCVSQAWSSAARV
jgi:hypothetical protein